MTKNNDELDNRLHKLAEDTVDALNRDALDDEAAPAMLTSYVLVVEGNGYKANGVPITRSIIVSHGSVTQVKGLLVDTLDDIRNQEREQ